MASVDAGCKRWETDWQFIDPELEGRVGTVYMLHLERPVGDKGQQHYAGWTSNLERRLEEHRTGNGSRVTTAAVDQGVTFVLAGAWTGTPDLEYLLKLRGRVCPYCGRRVPGCEEDLGGWFTDSALKHLDWMLVSAPEAPEAAGLIARPDSVIVRDEASAAPKGQRSMAVAPRSFPTSSVSLPRKEVRPQTVYCSCPPRPGFLDHDLCNRCRLPLKVTRGYCY